MAISRNSQPDQTVSAVESARRAIDQALAVHLPAGATPAAPTIDSPWLVGFSGGPDSTALIYLLAGQFDPQSLVAIHVDHGLHADAPRWSEHCRRVASELGTRFHAVGVGPAPVQPDGGLENWARDARRQAFLQAAGQFSASVLLLAHHADDQIETILHRLVRGAGVDGLAAMHLISQRDGLNVLRPLLGVRREQVLDIVRASGLQSIEDPSNRDTTFTRNRLRHAVVPQLDQICPGLTAGLLTSAQHMGQVSRALPALLFAQGVPTTLSRQSLRDAGSDVAPLMLRVWLRHRGARAPDAIHLNEMLRQFVAGHQSLASFELDGFKIEAYRDDIRCVKDSLNEQTLSAHSQTLVWHGQPCIELPDFGGRFLFQADTNGLPAKVIEGQAIQVMPLQMNARMRERPDGPSRTLRLLCQERGIAPNERRRLPMIRLGTEVIFAAGIGLNANWLTGQDIERVAIDWQAL